MVWQSRKTETCIDFGDWFTSELAFMGDRWGFISVQLDLQFSIWGEDDFNQFSANYVLFLFEAVEMMSDLLTCGEI